MTTAAAEALYLAQHRMEHEGRRWAVHNPHSKPLEDLPVIYGFNNGGAPGWFSAVSIAQDGHVLGGHCCSNEGYMEHDLGIIEGSRPDRHEESYRKHYPDGYRMEFVRTADLKEHQGLAAAFAAHDKLPRQPVTEPAGDGVETSHS